MFGKGKASNLIQQFRNARSFLPFTKGCVKIYCNEHYSYDINSVNKACSSRFFFLTLDFFYTIINNY